VMGSCAVEGLAVRQLDPPLALSLGVIQRRNTPDDPALKIVREAILTLADEREDGDGEVDAAPALNVPGHLRHDPGEFRRRREERRVAGRQ
jgi:hypothetical protein